MNRRVDVPHCRTGHLGERKIPCPGRELNHDSSALLPVTYSLG